MASRTGGIRVDRGIAYGYGQVLDVYTPLDAAEAPVVLLWHGVGANERDVLEPLARTTAALGVTVSVPDWHSGTADGGRAQLLASLSFTRMRVAESGGDARAIVLAGWSRGGKAAAGLAVNPAAVNGWQPSAVVCLGSGFENPAPHHGQLRAHGPDAVYRRTRAVLAGARHQRTRSGDLPVT